MSDAIHEFADALRHVGAGLDSFRSGQQSGSDEPEQQFSYQYATMQSPHSSDAAGYSFRSASSAGLDQVRGVVSGVVDDIFQGYDEIVVIELYFDADYDSVDHAQFKQAIFDNLRIMGLTEDRIALLKVTLRPSSVVAQISGPVHIIEVVHELPLNRMVVLGYQAKVLSSDGKQAEGEPVIQEVKDLDRNSEVAQELTTQGASFNELVPAEYREQAAQEVVQGIETVLRGETPGSGRSQALEEAVAAHALSARSGSKALDQLTDENIRALVKEALDAWFSDSRQELEALQTPTRVAAVQPLVRVPRPSSADLEQLTDRLYTGRSVYSTASSEQREDITMNLIMEMQTPLIAAAEAAPPLPRPSEETLEEMTSRVVARNAPRADVLHQDLTMNREDVIRDLFNQLTSVLFGGSPLSTARAQSPFHAVPQRPRPDGHQINSMAQRILTSRAWSSVSREGQEEAVRGMLTELTGSIFGEYVTPRSTATFETQPASARSLRAPSGAEIQRMALAVAERHGQSEADSRVVGMLNSMSDNLFGTAPVEVRTVGLHRPSPRGIEEIMQRVVSSTENSVREEVVQQVLVELSDALFGAEPGSSTTEAYGTTITAEQGTAQSEQRSSRRPSRPGSRPSSGAMRPSARSLDQAASRLTTARSVAQSSIGSGSSNSDDVRAVMNAEVRDLLGQLCNTLFGDTPIPSSRGR